ncbi:MAG: RdgB/HAM1 family non-canonical purine NTP pyrophosphatase [Candidatus Hydrogenedentes bacterium]|nr:RdgB/HAM1 family non-canonical purine NTP pyrophosphatase [Candidatus Hydrogenedentota bacterium]
MGKVLLLGSGSLDKARELAVLLEGLPVTLRTLQDFDQIEEPVEDGKTFEDNALIKARYYCKQFNVPCVADDSGLVVDALNGAPGIYSARYAGENRGYLENNRKLLAALEGVPMDQRTAHFVCCAAYAAPDGGTHVEEGTVEGRIAAEERGNNGFGYDPLFIPTGYESTFGELPPALKHEISHRARAFAKLKAYLGKWL